MQRKPPSTATPESVPRSRRTTLVGAAAVAALLLAGCSSWGVQSAADDEAASVADRYLPEEIDARLAGLETEDDSARVDRVQSWLDESSPDSIDSLPEARWMSGPPTETTIPVVVHYRVGETTLSDAARGLACRDYVIGDRVEIIATTCPAGTPETPRPGRTPQA